VPLGSFLRDLTNFSTIPFTLDPLALQANRVTPRTKVNVKLKDGTLEDALAEALKPHHLGYMVDPKGHVVITWPGQDGPKVLSEARYRIDDLVTDDASRTVLQQMIKELISPGGWTDAIDDEGATLRFESSQLVVEHNHSDHFRLALLLDKVRKARGLTPQNGFPKLALLMPRTTQILPKLSKPASFKFRYDTPLHDILQAIGKAGDLDVIINWQAAASVGWGPNAETSLLVDDRLVSNAFSNVLEPMDLTIRVLDAGSVEVTTWDQMAHQLDIEAYAVGHVTTPKTAEEWMSALKTKLAATTRSSRSRQWAFFYDEQSKHLFVRAPQVQHIRLSKILAPRP